MSINHLLSTLCLLLLPAVTVGKPVHGQEALAPHDLRVVFIDVGQGDSILIQTANGSIPLIDGGYDNGLALAYLKQDGISKLDVVIASHPHADHIGGLVEVMQALPAGAVWTSGASHTTSVFERFLDTIIEKKIPYHEAQTGDAIQIDDVVLNVLYSARQARNRNNTSLVLRLEYGAISILFMGDADAEIESALIQGVGQGLKFTILKVGHHGSHTSSTPAFLALVQSHVALYSAGRNNSYGHPHQTTIANLRATGATIFGTNVHGTMTVATDGNSFFVGTERQGTVIAENKFALTATMAPLVDNVAYDPLGAD